MHFRSSESKQSANEIAQTAPASEPSVSKDVLLQKFKDKTEELPPSLDKALRRAAAHGTIQDVEDLLQYGAKINSQDEKRQYTALHLAVKNSKPEMTAHLLKRHASRHLRDVYGNVAESYCEDKNFSIKKIFEDATPSVFKNNDILRVMLSFFDFVEISQMAEVRYNWNSVKEKLIKTVFSQRGLGQYYELFQGLSPLLKKIITKQKTGIAFEKILQVLALSDVERLQHIFPEDHARRKVEDYKPLLSDIGITLFLLREFTPEKLKLVSSEAGLTILREELVSLYILIKMLDIAPLLTKNGLMLLRKRIFKPEDLIHIYDLSTLISDQGLQALERGLISVVDARNRQSLALLKMPNGLIALEEKLITLDQAEKFAFWRNNSLSVLMSDVGLAALREGLITPEQASDYDDLFKTSSQGNLALLLSPTGVVALREKLISPLSLCDINEHRLCKIFPRDEINLNLLKALRYKLFSMEEISPGKKYCFISGPSSMRLIDLNAHLGELVAEYEKVHAKPKHVPESKEMRNAALIFQKHWRGKIARRKHVLFRERQACASTGAHDVRQLQQAKKM